MTRGWYDVCIDNVCGNLDLLHRCPVMPNGSVVLCSPVRRHGNRGYKKVIVFGVAAVEPCVCMVVWSVKE